MCIIVLTTTEDRPGEIPLQHFSVSTYKKYPELGVASGDNKQVQAWGRKCRPNTLEAGAKAESAVLGICHPL